MKLRAQRRQISATNLLIYYGRILLTITLMSCSQTKPKVNIKSGDNGVKVKTVAEIVPVKISSSLNLPAVSFSQPSEDLASVDRSVEVIWNSLNSNGILYESKICSEDHCHGQCQDQYRSNLSSRDIFLRNSDPQYVCVRAILDKPRVASIWSISKKISYNQTPQDINIQDLSPLDRDSDIDFVVGKLLTERDYDGLIDFEVIQNPTTDHDFFSVNRDNNLILTQSLDLLEKDKNQLVLEVKALLSGAKTINKRFIIPIGSTSIAPADLGISNHTILENQGATLIGKFMVFDNPGDTHNFQLLSEEFADYFEIVDGQLFSKKSFDFEDISSFQIKVKVTDSTELSIEKELIIEVKNQLESLDDASFKVLDADGAFFEGREIIEINLVGRNLFDIKYDYTMVLKSEGEKCLSSIDNFELIRNENMNTLLLVPQGTMRIPSFDININVTVENETQSFLYEYLHDGSKIQNDCEDKQEHVVNGFSYDVSVTNLAPDFDSHKKVIKDTSGAALFYDSIDAAKAACEQNINCEMIWQLEGDYTSNDQSYDSGKFYLFAFGVLPTNIAPMDGGVFHTLIR